jgi:hypothetical protein
MLAAEGVVVTIDALVYPHDIARKILERQSPASSSTPNTSCG